MAANEVNYQYPIKLYGQPTGMTCWSAATTMLFGTRFSAGAGNGQLGSEGGLTNTFDNIQSFAKSYGLKVYPMQSWTALGLINLLKRGPVAMLGAIPSLHAIVIGGIKSDGTEKGTELTIYDPWPINRGATYKVNYYDYITTHRLATMYMLQR